MNLLDDLKNKNVNHRKFGSGTIIDCQLILDENDIRMRIDFNGKEIKFSMKNLNSSIMTIDNVNDSFDYKSYLDEVIEKEKLKRLIEKKKNIIYSRRSFLENREIKYLAHFTRLDNLDSIIENGLLSINRLKDSNITYLPSDPKRKDNLDYICTTITFPNYRMFYGKRNRIQSEWCVILIDIQVILDKLDTLFLVDNGAEHTTIENVSNNRGSYTTNEALTHLFENTIKIRGISKSRQNNINNNMTTNPQSEVLVKDAIEKKYIKKIIVYDDKTKNKLINVYDYNTIPIEKNPSFFSGRADYEYWKKEN